MIKKTTQFNFRRSGLGTQPSFLGLFLKGLITSCKVETDTALSRRVGWHGKVEGSAAADVISRNRFGGEYVCYHAGFF